MAKKIILFLSELRGAQQEETYDCPDGGQATGRQTNEAPVQYLLRVHPDVREILCVVTPRAEESAWEPFRQAEGDDGRKVTGDKVFPAGQKAPGFRLPELLETGFFQQVDGCRRSVKSGRGSGNVV